MLRVLKPGGIYIFATLHKYSGPQDGMKFLSMPDGWSADR